jgi:quercetin dioxygenase-like cupin family protein
MNKLLLLLAVAASLAAPLTAEEMKPADHGFFAPDAIVWGPAPPVLPAGAKVAVLKGDPGQEGIFVMRAWLPAGYQIMPHWHPAFENVTVISGEGHLGMGDTFDKTQGQVLPAGSFAYMAPQTHHYFWTETETVLQLHGMGPWQLYYLNPADDPRNQPAM